MYTERRTERDRHGKANRRISGTLVANEPEKGKTGEVEGTKLREGRNAWKEIRKKRGEMKRKE
jgi:hypothetical protein